MPGNRDEKQPKNNNFLCIGQNLIHKRCTSRQKIIQLEEQNNGLERM